MSKVENNVIFNENTKLVHYALNKYFNGGVGYDGFTREDLYQIGCIGLLNCIPRFDKSLGYTFSTYAMTYISGEIKKELSDKTILVKYPRLIRGVARLLNKEEEKETLTIEQIAEKYEISEKDAKLVIECMRTFFTVSLDSSVEHEDGSSTLSDIIASDYSLEDSILESIELKERLAVLTDKERTVIDLSLKAVNQKDIGKILGISQVQVSRIVKKAVLKINEHFDDKNMKGVLN